MLAGVRVGWDAGERVSSHRKLGWEERREAYIFIET